MLLQQLQTPKAEIKLHSRRLQAESSRSSRNRPRDSSIETVRKPCEQWGDATKGWGATFLATGKGRSFLGLVGYKSIFLVGFGETCSAKAKLYPAPPETKAHRTLCFTTEPTEISALAGTSGSRQLTHRVEGLSFQVVGLLVPGLQRYDRLIE